ncbi:MAG: primosomal protein N', partial [Gemmatimonadetes bacterium]|nr:primosomal protein N' [Gemmatimonadota bacterium]
MRVLAPFGPRVLMGCVVQLIAESPIPRLKSIRRIIDPAPMFDEERWGLADWLARYYYCSLGEALTAMVPSGLRIHTAPRDVVAEPRHAEHGARPRSTVPLTIHQAQALTLITAALDASRSATILLHGVTASGKTELYLQAIERVLGQGRSAICLVPEISLTPQLIDRFRERFSDEVVVWHSRVLASARSEAWRRLSDGASRIVVGARSAVFAPVRKLGLVILDEEHEASYKQEDVPRYHARDVATTRAALTGAAIVLGSATPSVESVYAAQRGRIRLAALPERVRNRALPHVEIVDVREQLATRHRHSPLSARLHHLLQQTVERGEQAILLLNRRGFARTAQCPTCGVVARCRRCDVPLVYHASRRELLCHYCNFREPPDEICQHCRKGSLRFRGAGTERIESELHRFFPGASIARMDRDSTKSRESHRQIYEAVKRRDVSLLVGTQMVAKGWDFPDVTLVGVVSADTALNLPDFRAGERTFDLLTQAAGR